MVDDVYEGREQSRVKHEVLRRYLGAFAHIVGSSWQSITYIDGFSGPWNARSDDLSDTSFSIALNELRRARETHLAKCRSLKIRCVFVEKDPAAYERLKEFTESAKDAEIRTIPGEFENAIGEIMRFVRQESDTFLFTLIDPTGFSGFGMQTISPLLNIRPGEVLINFMLESIRRHIEYEGLRDVLSTLFGTDAFDASLGGLYGIDRDDAITEEYCDRLGRSCGFQHVLRASILHPDKDRLNYQLIYGTRNSTGVVKFKDAEKKAMEFQETSRARVDASRDKRRSGGQMSFLDPDEMPESAYYRRLRARYLAQARDVAVSLINDNARLPYDQLWLPVIRRPLVWKSDLQGWLDEWLEQRSIAWEGRNPREKTFKEGVGHVIVRRADRIN